MQFGDLRVASLLFADDVVPVALSGCHLLHLTNPRSWFSAGKGGFPALGMRVGCFPK